MKLINEYFQNPIYAAEFINIIESRNASIEEFEFFYQRLTPVGVQDFSKFILDFIRKTEKVELTKDIDFDSIVDLKREEYTNLLKKMAEVSPLDLSVEAYFKILVFNTFILENKELTLDYKLEILNKIEEIVNVSYVEETILSDFYTNYLVHILSMEEIDMKLMNNINNKLKKSRKHHSIRDFI